MVPDPVQNRLFMNQIHGADQLHPRKIRTVQLGHHGLHLAAVQHSHKDRLDHVVKMMPQCDLIAAMLLCMGIEKPPAHPRTEIAGIFPDVHHHIKNIGLEDGYGNAKKRCIFLNSPAVPRVISRIHHQKYQFKRKFSMTRKLLQKLRHQHGILAARNADRNPVPFLNQIIILNPTGARLFSCIFL